jgi:hypothetical protein
MIRIVVAPGKAVDIPMEVEQEGPEAIDAFVLLETGVDLAGRRSEVAQAEADARMAAARTARLAAEAAKPKPNPNVAKAIEAARAKAAGTVAAAESTVDTTVETEPALRRVRRGGN